MTILFPHHCVHIEFIDQKQQFIYTENGYKQIKLFLQMLIQKTIIQGLDCVSRLQICSRKMKLKSLCTVLRDHLHFEDLHEIFL